MKGRRSRYNRVASTGSRTTSFSPGRTVLAQFSASSCLPMAHTYIQSDCTSVQRGTLDSSSGIFLPPCSTHILTVRLCIWPNSRHLFASLRHTHTHGQTVHLAQFRHPEAYTYARSDCASGPVPGIFLPPSGAHMHTVRLRFCSAWHS